MACSDKGHLLEFKLKIEKSEKELEIRSPGCYGNIMLTLKSWTKSKQTFDWTNTFGRPGPL